MTQEQSLKSLVSLTGVSLNQFADEAKVTRTTLAKIVNHGEWPKTMSRSAIAESIATTFGKYGVMVTPEMVMARASNPSPSRQPKGNSEDKIMIIRKSTIS